MADEWWFLLGLGYAVVTVGWFTFCAVMWNDVRTYKPDDAPVAAWWATRAPLWPFYLLRGLSRGMRRLLVDAVKGRSMHE